MSLDQRIDQVVARAELARARGDLHSACVLFEAGYRVEHRLRETATLRRSPARAGIARCHDLWAEVDEILREVEGRP